MLRAPGFQEWTLVEPKPKAIKPRPLETTLIETLVGTLLY